MTDRDELPIPDYDHLPVGSLASRVRTLDAGGLETLLAYEKAHGNRLPVTEVLNRRLEALRSGQAEPSGGDPAAAQPEHAPAPAGDTPGQDTDQTDNNQPLRHGVAGQTPNRNVRSR